MAFDSVQAFLAMGKHGFYVWLSYGVTALVLAGIAWQAWRSESKILSNLRRRQAREARRQKAREESLT
ncbi:heme exporter protein CcmD [Gallaecimonas sp. GXIMD4217]|uniref:heme exporter protein CcmD n=1 Tax=Gallaecimonas sp. GXIMD4217 TaxID=3131927 RepID=UPI00311ACB35